MGVMNVDERATAIGYVEVTFSDGTAITAKNRLTDHARASLAALTVGEFVKTPSRIVLGVGAPTAPFTGPTPDDTALWVEVSDTRRTVDVKSTFLTYTSEFGVTYDTGEVNDVDFTEAGLEDADGVMWAHVMFEMPIRKNALQTMSVRWKILHVGN